MSGFEPVGGTSGSEGGGIPGAHASSHLSTGSDPISNATTSVSGLLSPTDKSKINRFIDVVADYGADPTGVSDSLAAFQSARNAAAQANRVIEILVPSGTYSFSDTFVVDRPIRLRGAGSRGGLQGTVLVFPPAYDGIKVAYQGGPIGGGGAGSHISYLTVEPSVGTAGWAANITNYASGSTVVPTTYAGFVMRRISGSHSGTSEPTWPTTEGGTVVDNTGSPTDPVTWEAHYVAGVKLLGSAHIENVFSTGFAGDGFSVFADSGDGDNANNWCYTRCSATENIGYGFYTEKPDSNGGTAINCYAFQNTRGGLVDNSSLGNFYFGCGAEANGTAGVGIGFKVPTVALSNASVFSACYVESGQSVDINNQAMFIGGRGTGYGNGIILAPARSNSLYFSNDSNDAGTGNSAYIRIGRVGTQGTLEYGWSQDSLTPLSLGYGAVNGTGETGWIGHGTSTLSNYAFSLGNATEGRGHFWVPNNFYLGPPALRSQFENISIGPPTSGAHIAGDFVHEASPQITGMFGFVTKAAGTPGTFAPLQPFGTQGAAGDVTVSVLDRYIGITSTAAARTISLFAITSYIPDGWQLIIKDESGAAGAPNAITVTPDGTDQIDGVNASKKIVTPYGKLQLVKRNGKWWTVADAGGTVTQRNVAKTGDYTLLASDSGSSFTNAGASADIILSLPTLVIGQVFKVMVITAFYIKILAAGSSQVYLGSNLSAAGGYVRSNIPGACLEIEATAAGIWSVTNMTSTWTEDV